jgi:hypothetical protein
MTQRVSLYAADEDYDAVAYAPILPTATPVVVEVAQEYYAENVDNDDDESSDKETPL